MHEFVLGVLAGLALESDLAEDGDRLLEIAHLRDGDGFVVSGERRRFSSPRGLRGVRVGWRTVREQEGSEGHRREKDRNRCACKAATSARTTRGRKPQ